jgi:hypothetical protein
METFTWSTRKLHDEEFHYVYYFPKVNKDQNYKVEEDEVGGTCGTNRGEEKRV